MESCRRGARGGTGAPLECGAGARQPCSLDRKAQNRVAVRAHPHRTPRCRPAWPWAARSRRTQPRPWGPGPGPQARPQARAGPRPRPQPPSAAGRRRPRGAGLQRLPLHWLQGPWADGAARSAPRAGLGRGEGVLRDVGESAGQRCNEPFSIGATPAAASRAEEGAGGKRAAATSLGHANMPDLCLI